MIGTKISSRLDIELTITGLRRKQDSVLENIAKLIHSKSRPNYKQWQNYPYQFCEGRKSHSIRGRVLKLHWS